MLPRLRQFSTFCAVGAVGFCVDAGVLYLVLAVWPNPYLARLLSYLVAATTTWLLHRAYTFRDTAGPRTGRQWMAYVSTNAAGGAVNYGIYAACVTLWPAARAEPVLAVAAGSAAALAINFLVNKHVVYRQPARAGWGGALQGRGGS